VESDGFCAMKGWSNPEREPLLNDPGLIQRLLSYIKFKIGVESYNFKWSNWSKFCNGPIVRLTILIPIFGYAVIFNDIVIQNVEFESLTSKKSGSFLFNSDIKIKITYFSFVLLAIGSAIYSLRRPHTVKFADNETDYIEKSLNNFDYDTFLSFHGSIRGAGYDPYTTRGKYYDSQWDAFINDVRSSEKTTVEGYAENAPNWQNIKKKHELLLRSLLYEYYFGINVTRRRSLLWAVVCSAIGYFFIFLLSLDLFLAVIRSMFV
jgi:hypothetical protein